MSLMKNLSVQVMLDEGNFTAEELEIEIFRYLSSKTDVEVKSVSVKDGANAHANSFVKRLLGKR